MRAARTLAGAGVGVGALAMLLCAQVPSAPARKPAADAPKAPAAGKVVPGKGSASTNALPVVGHLATRDRTITIEIGPQGPRYTVRRKDGGLLHQSLSEKELQSRAPELHRLIKDSVAGSLKDGGRTTDARLKPRLDGRLDGRR